MFKIHFLIFILLIILLFFYVVFLQSLSCCSVEEDSSFGQSTALVEACRNRDVPLVDLLLKHGARDDDCKGLLFPSKIKMKL